MPDEVTDLVATDVRLDKVDENHRAVELSGLARQLRRAKHRAIQIL